MILSRLAISSVRPVLPPPLPGGLRALSSQSGLPQKVLILNRSSAATRASRTYEILGVKVGSIYPDVDSSMPHRFLADQSHRLNHSGSPVSAYLDYKEIIALAKKEGYDAIHPMFGFVSEEAPFYEACLAAGIRPIGAKPEAIRALGDKVSARNIAIELGIPVVPGTPEPITDLDAARAFIASEGVGYPVIIKAAGGGGGKGMRVVSEESELEPLFKSATGEALRAFGNGAVFIEKFLEAPRHVEVQIVSDGKRCATLFDRSCDAQRRYQKLVEIAPALISEETRAQIHAYAKALALKTGYNNVGTVEFIIDTKTGHPYFMEVNTRIQVEHTVTEEVMGVDIIDLQTRLSYGLPVDFDALDALKPKGVSIQCRITAEGDDLLPAAGTVMGASFPTMRGFRQEGPVRPGMQVGAFDAMLTQLVFTGKTLEEACSLADYGLKHTEIYGIETNISFLRTLLNPDLLRTITTNAIDQDLKGPGTFIREARKLGAERRNTDGILRFLAMGAVNGHGHPGMGATPSIPTRPPVPPVALQAPERSLLKQLIDTRDYAGLRRYLNGLPTALITDTTMRDAHQSKIATRLRIFDLLPILPYYNRALSPHLGSLEVWGGATYDVDMRFLRNCPWDRLDAIREAVPNLPLQMLLRGANAVGYTAYADNALGVFAKKAVKHGMDIFRIFDALNDIDNLSVGITAVHASGGLVEAAVCYTGNVLDTDSKYNLDYYLNLVRRLDTMDIHILCIKDMAGLLTPDAATLLVSTLKREFPHLPIHVHTHDSGGTGVAAMLAASKAGASMIDAAMDSWGGSTSQPKMGSILQSLPGTSDSFKGRVAAVNDYWLGVLDLYRRVGSAEDQPTSALELAEHEMPGGQYTNLLFQARAVGVPEQWPAVKKAYAQANQFLGDIPKVTPSSKVVGDLALFMVQNKLSLNDLIAHAGTLSFPSSVVDYFRGGLGTPPGGFPPYRALILEKAGLTPYKGRPGAELPNYDFDGARQRLSERFPKLAISEEMVMNYCMYPDVTLELLTFQETYGTEIPTLPTYFFWEQMKEGDTVETRLKSGKEVSITLHAIGKPNKEGLMCLTFTLNGVELKLLVPKKSEQAKGGAVAAPKADRMNDRHVGAPMNGKLLSLEVKVGDTVVKGQRLFKLEAMKMENAVAASVDGKIKTIHPKVGETVSAGDSVIEFE